MSNSPLKYILISIILIAAFAFLFIFLYLGLQGLQEQQKAASIETEVSTEATIESVDIDTNFEIINSEITTSNPSDDLNGL